MTPTVVPATLAHAELLATLHAGCFREAWGAPAMAGLLSLPTTLGFIAVCAEEPVGFVLVSLAGGESEILSIGVSPARRRRGVGRLLLAAAMAAARAGGADRMLLEVAESDPAAVALYHDCGFEAVGRRPNYYASGVEALILRRRLSD